MLQYWIGLNAVDALLTGLSIPLGAVEMNPFLSALASTMSLERMLLIKVLFAVALGGAIWLRGAYQVLRVLNWIMVAVVFYNALVITYTL